MGCELKKKLFYCGSNTVLKCSHSRQCHWHPHLYFYSKNVYLSLRRTSGHLLLNHWLISNFEVEKKVANNKNIFTVYISAHVCQDKLQTFVPPGLFCSFLSSSDNNESHILYCKLYSSSPTTSHLDCMLVFDLKDTYSTLFSNYCVQYTD